MAPAPSMETRSADSGPARQTFASGRKLALLAALVLAACGPAGDVSQVAARVNDADVTVHQVNFALQQQDRPLPAEQVDAASRRLLESLIDQELAVQKSIELKLDRDPQVVQALEAARREVLARAYRERISQDGARPSAEEVRRFYEATPALFAQRRVYTVQELQVDAPAARLPWLRQRLSDASSVDDFAAALQAEGLRFSAGQLVRAAEQLPMALVEPFARLKEGDAAVVAEGPPTQVYFIEGAKPEPLSLERAAPAIEQYLATQARRRTIDENLKALRTAAQIRYQGKFAPSGTGSAASTPAAPGLDVASAAAQSMQPVQMALPADGSSEPVKLDMPAASPAPQTAGSAIDPNLAKKGMGLK
jgi:EpsD family peptidyl-prolyl cis-trans isomerase